MQQRTRPWWRFHLSTVALSAAAAALLFLLNVPGSRYPNHPHLACQHGWPFVYATSGTLYVGSFRTLLPTLARGEAWSWTTNFDEFDAWLLAADVAIALVAVLLLATLWEWRRRHLRSAFNFRLTELFALMLTVALIGAWWVSWQVCYQREQQARALLPRHALIGTEYVGPRWLSHFLTAKQIPGIFMSYCSLSVDIPGDISREQGLAVLTMLPHITRLRLAGPGADKAFLIEVSEQLDVTMLSFDNWEFAAADLPVFARFANLRSLEFKHTRITDENIADLAGLRGLTFLTLANPGLTIQGHQRLRDTLPGVRIEYH